MRLAVLILACFLVAPVAQAQDKARKKPAAKKQLAHKKPTPEQIRKFNQLQKKKQRDAKG